MRDEDIQASDDADLASADLARADVDTVHLADAGSHDADPVDAVSPDVDGADADGADADEAERIPERRMADQETFPHLLPGAAWGTSITTRRAAELEERLRAWEQEARQGARTGPFAGVRLTGAEVFWLAARALAGTNEPQAVAAATDRLQRARTQRALRATLDLSALHLGDADLHAAYLGHAVLRRAHLEGASLAGAYLERAVLEEAHLEDADLRTVELGHAVLRGAHLEGADLREAQLEAAWLKQAYLTDAHLDRAHLEEAWLGEAHLEGATLDSARLARATLSAAHLEEAHLDGANLEHAILREAHLEGAYLVGVRLNGANLSHAHLEGAHLMKAHLAGADLNGAHLEEAHLDGTHLKGASLREAHLERADLGVANLEGADLWQAHLQGLVRGDANFEGARLEGAHLEGAHLEGAHLEGRAHRPGELIYQRVPPWAPHAPPALAPADLRRAFLDRTTMLTGVTLGQPGNGPGHGYVRVADMQWGGVNLAVIRDQLAELVLGDERAAWEWRPPRQTRAHPSRAARKRPSRKERAAARREQEQEHLDAFRAAVRANRQLAAALREQGMHEEADRFAYRAQVCQRRLLRLQHQRGRWLFQTLLAVLAGYGYRLRRILVAYVVTLLLFAAIYFVLGVPGSGGELTLPGLRDAVLVSLSALHGRVLLEQLGQYGVQTWVAAIESVVGIVIEGVFVALLVQRFFGGR